MKALIFPGALLALALGQPALAPPAQAAPAPRLVVLRASCRVGVSDRPERWLERKLSELQHAHTHA